MRIQRNQLSFRKRNRRHPGCVSLALLLVGVVVGLAAVSWGWLGSRLPFASQPPQDDAYNGAAQAFDQGDLDGAITGARRALEQNPDHTDALILLVRALIYRSYSDYNRAIDRESALEVTTEALTRSSGDAKILAIHAYALQAVGRATEAARIAQQALDRQPGNTLARIANGLAYGGAGSFNIALRESQQANAQGDWPLESLRAMAISYSDLGDYQSAIETIEKALRLNRHLIPLYFERALYALQIGDTDAATASYYQILTFAPENVKVRLRLCEVSSLLREREAAIGYCQEVTERAPSWADGWYQLGLEYFLQGDFLSAQDSLHRCSTLQVMQDVPVIERKFGCWYLQGQAAEILGDCPNLLATYNEFRAMAAEAPIQETWLYPPEGPPGCTLSQTASSP